MSEVVEADARGTEDSGGSLPLREGAPPRTTRGVPHLQLDQFAPPDLQRTLRTRIADLPYVNVGSSGMGPTSAEAFSLNSQFVGSRLDSFLVGTEFAHLHGDGSGSLHMTLPSAASRLAIEGGWAIRHPFAGGFLPTTAVLVFGPRSALELETVWWICLQSYNFARSE